MAEVPAAFVAACHWRLYAEALVGRDGLPNTDIPKGGPPEVRLAAVQQSIAVAAVRDVLFPEDE
jgi:hypothetical protein